MANEARVSIGFRLIIGNQREQDSESFNVDVVDGGGPSPGMITATTAGVSVSFSALSTPALCILKNLDDTNFVEFGIWDGSTFHELGEILPGEAYIIRLSRNMTGFRLKADTASCDVKVEAYSA